MRRIFILFAFLLTACSSPAGTQPVRTATPATPTVSPLLIISPSPSATRLPTKTRLPQTLTPKSWYRWAAITMARKAIPTPRQMSVRFAK